MKAFTGLWVCPPKRGSFYFDKNCLLIKSVYRKQFTVQNYVCESRSNKSCLADMILAASKKDSKIRKTRKSFQASP